MNDELYPSTRAEAGEWMRRAGHPELAIRASQLFDLSRYNPQAYCDLRPEPGTPDSVVLSVIGRNHPIFTGIG